MTSWLLWFILLNPDASTHFNPYTKYVTMNDVVCNQDKTVAGVSSLDRVDPVQDPTGYYFDDPDPGRQGKYCRLSIGADVLKLSPGTYLAVGVSMTHGTFALIDKGHAELFIKN